MRNEFGWLLLSALGFFIVVFLRFAIETIQSIFNNDDEEKN